MDENTRALLTRLLSDCPLLVNPLAAVADQPYKLYERFSALGWELEGLLGEDLTTLAEAVADIRAALADAASAAERDSLDAALAAARPALAAALQKLKDVQLARAYSNAPVVHDAVAAALVDDTLEWLFVSFLYHHWPTLYHMAVALRLITFEAAAALYAEGATEEAHADDLILRYPVSRPTVNFAQIKTLLAAPFAFVERVLSETTDAASGADSPQVFLEQLGAQLSAELTDLARALGEEAAESLYVRLDPSGLEFKSPHLSLADAGPVPLPLPADARLRLEVSVSGGNLRIAWPDLIPTAEGGGLKLFEAGGFAVKVPGASDDAADVAGAGLTLRGAGATPELEVVGALRLEVPAAVLTRERGDAAAGDESKEAHGAVCCRLVLRAGETPTLSFDRLELGGSFHLGGEGGLTVKEAVLTVEALTFPLPHASADRPVPFDLSVVGKFSLPGDDVRVEVAGRYAAGSFSLASTGAIKLGNGVELLADGDAPVLSLEAQPSRGLYAFAVGGAMKFPGGGAGGASGGGAVAVRGRMEIEAAAGGVRVNSFAAAGRVEDWPLWGDTRLKNFAVALGFERGSYFARLACTVPLGGGFELALLDAPPEGWAETAAAPATGLTVTQDGSVTNFLVQAGMSLSVPADVLTGAEGDEPVVVEAFGSLEVSTDAGVAPALHIDLARLRAERIHLGGEGGLVVENAEVELRHVDRLFGAQSEPFFQMVFSGDLVCPVEDAGGSLTLKLRGACFTFRDREAPPEFVFENDGGLGFETGRLGNLPIQITEAFIHLKHGGALPDVLDPENLEITLGAEIALPVSSSGMAIGAVRGLTVSIERGLPRVVLRGVTVGVSDMMIATIKFSGAMSLDNLTEPANLVIAGVLGGSYNGMGVKALVAFRMLDGAPAPLGVCLDVSGGQSGITVAYGFVIIGASGGVSFANTNADPCDFATYVRVTQPIRKGRALPAGQPGKSAPSDRPVGFDGCPCKCPPPAMNILCQPHPDQERFSGRVILKFSSLDEAFLSKLAVPDESGKMVTLPEYLRGLDAQIDAEVRAGRAADPGALAARVVAGLLDRTEAEVRAFIPASADPAALVPPPPEGLRSIYVDPAAYWKRTMRPALEQGVREMIGRAADAAVGERPSVYGVVRDVLYRGVPCPDETMQLTGTFSYTGVQVFLSVTGGVSISTTGSVGVLGYLNIFGLPVGQLRAFVTATGSTGDIDPSLCGDLRFEIGPLYLGQMSLLYDCPNCVTDFRDSLIRLGAALGGPVIERIMRRIDEGLAQSPRFDPSGDPAGTLALLDAQQASSFIAQLYSTSFEPADAARVEDFAKGLLRATWASFNPRVVACGRVAVKLFGLKLGEPIVEARALVEKERPEGSFRLTASFGFSPTFIFERTFFGFYSLLSGSDSATMSVYVPFPGPEEVVLDGIAGRYNSPESFMAYLDAGLEKFLVDAALTFTYEFAPLGFKLVQAAGRVVMPYLTPHPESTRPYTSGLAGGTPRRWTNPDALSDAPPDKRTATRLEVLEAVLESGKLADIFWKGELADIFPDRRGAMSRALLQRDYFPHGGLIGASRVIVPGVLYYAPRLDLLDAVVHGTDTAARLKPLVEFVKSCLETVEAGTLAFYLPAPNPPKVLRDDPRETARRLIQSISDLDPARFMSGEQLVGGDLYPLDLAFLRGHLDGQLLGIPISNAAVEFSPPGRAGGKAQFKITAAVGEDTWLHQFVPRAKLEFVARQAPPEPIDSRFGQLLSKLEARTGNEAARELLIAEALTALDEGLPKVSLEVSVEGPRTIMKGLLGIEAGAPARLFAYSPRYEPGHTGKGLLADARREGGIVFMAALRFGDMLTIPNAAMRLTPPGKPTDLPRMEATLDVRALAVPGTSLRLSDAKLHFDSGKLSFDRLPDAGPALEVSGRAAPWRISSSFSIEPHDRPALEVSVEVGLNQNDAARTCLKLNPARLRLPLFGESVVLAHGESKADPFTFATAEAWDAGVSVESLYLNSPYNPNDAPLLRIDTPVSGILSGNGLTLSDLCVTLTVPENTSVTLFPADTSGLTQTFQLKAALTVKAGGDGKFEASLGIPPLRFGALIIHGEGGREAWLQVRLTHYGFTLPRGARLTIDGVSADGAIRLNQFVINGDGDFSVTATTRTLKVGGLFKLSASSIRVWREGVRAGVEFRAPSVRPLPAASFTSDERFALGPDSLLIDSDGRFACDAGQRTIAAPDFSLSGQLTFGYDPDESPEPGPYLRLTDADVRVRSLRLDFADSTVIFTPTLISASGEQRIEVPDLLTVAGEVSFTYDIAAGVPTASFGNVLVRIPPLFEFNANVQLSPDRMSARGATIPWPGVLGLLEFTPGEWSFAYEHGSQFATLRTQPQTVWVLGQGVTADADIAVTAKKHGDYRAEFSTRTPFGFAPLFEIGGMSLALWREGGGPQLDVSGTLRLLRIAGATPAPGGGAVGEGRGTITGLVTDSSGAALARASVTAIFLATSGSRTAQTDDEGRYTLHIPAGDYTLVVSAIGFADERSWRVGLASGQTLQLDFTLRPGAGASASTLAPDGSLWLIASVATLRATEGAFEARLYADTRGGLALPAPLGRAPSGLLFNLRRDAAGRFNLDLRDLRLNLLGNTLTLGGSVGSDGQLRLTLNAGTSLTVGVFTVVLVEDGWVEFNLLSPTDPPLRAGFPGVRLESSIPGWPAEGFAFEGFGLQPPEFGKELKGIDWTYVPGTPVQYKVEGPRLVVNLSDAPPAASLIGGPIRARVIDREDRAWFETSGGSFNAAINHTTGDILLPLPALSDPAKGERDACIQKANEDYGGSVVSTPWGDVTVSRDPIGMARAIAECWVNYPGPPDLSLPTLTTVTVNLRSFIG
ncbi:MAG TPA: carboxypeptidase regulatory-like domain-containing protein [Pyrinomonadaceae bacterium]|jgi:hypothetical protein